MDRPAAGWSAALADRGRRTDAADLSHHPANVGVAARKARASALEIGLLAQFPRPSGDADGAQLDRAAEIGLWAGYDDGRPGIIALFVDGDLGGRVLRKRGAGGHGQGGGNKQCNEPHLDLHLGQVANAAVPPRSRTNSERSFPLRMIPRWGLPSHF